MNEMTAGEAAEELCRISRAFDTTGACSYAASILRAIAAGEYKQVVHAHWIKRPFPHIGGELRCSHCNGIFSTELYRYNYCPSCGALMDGKGDST